MNSHKSQQSRLPEHLRASAIDLWGRAGSEHWITVSGHSMLPLIHDRDQLRVRHGHAAIRRGSIIVFQCPDVLIAHRIIYLGSNLAEPTLVTKGDHVANFDPPLSSNQILGVVLGIQRAGKYISLDTRFWRAFGECIALSTIAWDRTYIALRTIKRKFLGARPSPITGFVYRVMRWLFESTLGIVSSLSARWK